MRERFDCLVGYSDHTQSILPCIGAAALGACVVEKHFTLDRQSPGPDHTTSETPVSFAELVSGIRTIEAALGSAHKTPSPAELDNMLGMRRSIAARRALRAGQIIDDEDLTCKRPASGIPPREWTTLVGRTAARDVVAGALLQWADLTVDARPMTPEEAVDLERGMAAEDPTYLAHFSAFKVPGELQRQAAAAKRDAFFPIYSGGSLSGFYCVRGLDAGFARPSFGVYVASGAQGRGLARAALRDAVAWCRDHAIPKMMLKVSPLNEKARRAYLDAGFVAQGTCPDSGHTLMEKIID
jgi:RimJ/RimL family protein N-acetyltransferase